MVWARIPPDKLVHLPLFGIDVIAEDDNLLWLRGPSGRMCVDKRAPRIWFDDIGDAHQAGATAFKVAGAEEAAVLKEFMDREITKAAILHGDGGGESGPSDGEDDQPELSLNDA